MQKISLNICKILCAMAIARRHSGKAQPRNQLIEISKRGTVIQPFVSRLVPVVGGAHGETWQLTKYTHNILHEAV